MSIGGNFIMSNVQCQIVYLVNSSDSGLTYESLKENFQELERNDFSREVVRCLSEKLIDIKGARYITERHRKGGCQ